jgi:hypothetical protein
LVQSIELTPAGAVVLRADSIWLAATPRSASGAVMDVAVTWASEDTVVARVRPGGLVLAVAPGATRIIATAGRASASAPIEVLPRPPDRVVILPEPLTLVARDSAQLTARLEDDLGHPLESAEAVAWSSSDTSVVVVTEHGLAHAIAPGLAQIRASTAGLTGTLGVLVGARPVARVVVVPDSVDLAWGDSIQLVALVENDLGEPLDLPVTWSSSDTDVVTVDDDGWVRAVREGNARITAQVGAVAGRAGVVVLEPHIVSVQVFLAPSISITDSVLLMVDDSMRLGAWLVDARGNAGTAEPGGVTWSSSVPSVARVDELSGTVAGLAAGEAVISATKNGLTGSVRVRVAQECVASRLLGITEHVGGYVDWLASGTGELAPGPCTVNGFHQQGWTFQLPQDTVITITMRSAGLDSYLIVTDRDLAPVARDDDSGGGSAAALTLRMTAGRYVAWATSYAPGESGTYGISLVPATKPSASARPIAFGESHLGILAPGSVFTPPTFDIWRLELDTAAALEIHARGLESTPPPPLLLADGLLKHVIATGDRESTFTREDWSAIVRRELPAGAYMIIVGPSTTGNHQAYRLSVEEQQPVAARHVTLGDSVVATLTQGSDFIFPTDIWRLELEEPERVQIDVATTAFPLGRLLLTTDELESVASDDYLGQDPSSGQIRRDLEVGSYLVWVHTRISNRTGDYRLAVQPIDPCLPAEPLMTGAAVVGALSEEPCSVGPVRYAFHALTVPARSRVRVMASSPAFGPHLNLVGPDVDVLVDAPAGGTAVIDRMLDAGEYTVWIASVGDTGSYTLRAEGEELGASLGIAPGEFVSGTLARMTCAAGGPSGPIGAVDCAGARWRLDLAEAEWLEFDLGGAAAQLTIIDEPVRTLRVLDTSVFSEGAWLTVPGRAHLQRGSYLIQVAGEAIGAAYSLALTRVLDRVPCAPSRSIDVDEKGSGELVPTRCSTPGYQHEGWRLVLEQIDSLAIAAWPRHDSMVGPGVGTGGVRPVLAIARGTELVAGGEPLAGLLRPGDAAVWTELTAGEYQLWIWNATPGSSGAYQVSVHPGAGCTPGSIGLGQTVHAPLQSGPCTWDRWYFAPWVLELHQPTRVQIDLASDEFDPFLSISAGASPNDDFVRDDDGGPGWNARLVTDLAAGSYLIWVTSFRPGELGSYELTVAEDAAALVAADGVPDAVRRTDGKSGSGPTGLPPLRNTGGRP